MADEHGNRPDTCGHCTLLPTLRGYVRAAQVDCPEHGGPAVAAAANVARVRTQAERDTDGTTWRATCCDLHGIHCEPPADLCCHQCTEAAHPDHRPGERCVLPGAINDRYTRRPR